MLLRILFFIFYGIFCIVDGQNNESSRLCHLRCLGFCIKSGRNEEMLTCQNKCQEYSNSNLCSQDDDVCWQKCRDLPLTEKSKTARLQLLPLENITFEYTEQFNLRLSWNPVPNADFYLIYVGLADNPLKKRNLTSMVTFIEIETPLEDGFCQERSIQIQAVSGDFGLGPLSESTLIPAPRPRVSPTLKLLSMNYDKLPYKTPNYEANGTITITFRYSAEWPLGDGDLDVVPMFHMMMCAEPDLTQAVPVPDFYKGPMPFTIQAKLGSDMMYRRCRFIYSVQEVHSKRCEVSEFVHAQTPDFSSIEINCDNVLNNDCKKSVIFPGPICGQVDRFSYQIIDKDRIDWHRKESKIAVNISFTPYNQPSRGRQPLYYVALYGDAQPYGSSQEETLLGVNMTTIRGKASNCLNFAPDQSCLETVENSIILTNLTMDKLYGVMICGVIDPRNLTFPPINVDNRAIKTKANKLFISSKEHKTSNTGLIVGIIVTVFAILIIGGCVVFFILYRRERGRTKKLADLERTFANMDPRYTNCPSKTDIWELERRNLILYEDKKLGSGAFGAVYLGKLIGKAEGSKDAQSTLGINLMRAENCLVAVKMLPEYADEMSKSEFLQEIALMKKLGYHERLVNMLACVTESEPYCLVVEYCSDGDLLHFLRERCQYMLKLDEEKVDYLSPDSEFDPDMIMTVKQLLMFSVQISYGLEYLAQKGFVHRDVAARNVLVHDRSSAKIGDFGLCRYIYAESANYKSKGGRLPIKWMSPEAIRHYEFTTKSDVWSFGILMFEIITLGGTPYPGIQPDDMLKLLENGNRMPQPDNCPDDFYKIMKSCWTANPADRPDFSSIRQQLAIQLEEISDEYSYLKLDGGKDYYNVAYHDQKRPENELTIPPDSDMDSSTIQAAEKPAKKALAPFRPPIPPRANELNDFNWNKISLERNDSGVSIELDSDQFLLPTQGKENMAFSNDSSRV